MAFFLFTQLQLYIPFLWKLCFMKLFPELKHERWRYCYLHQRNEEQRLRVCRIRIYKLTTSVNLQSLCHVGATEYLMNDMNSGPKLLRLWCQAFVSSLDLNLYFYEYSYCHLIYSHINCFAFLLITKFYQRSWETKRLESDGLFKVLILHWAENSSERKNEKKIDICIWIRSANSGKRS